MKQLLEPEIFAEVVDETVNPERLEQLGRPNGTGYHSYADCLEYIICHVDYYDKEEFVKEFKLTDALKNRWEYYGIDFDIYLYLRDGKITGGHIFKYKTISSGYHFRPTGYEMSPTQQEIRIAKRILHYLTK